MLRVLKIENLALIESLELSFAEVDGSGLVVMTGETGAGKSIMLRAIQLLSGGRASVDWIRSDSDYCTVEALFEIHHEHGHLLQLLSDGGFGEDNTVIIKRVLSVKGRSKLYVNGSLATAKTVSLLTDNMLNIASQHDHQQLLQPALHLDILDTLGGHWQKRGSLNKLYGLWQDKKRTLHQLQKQEQEKEKKKDFLRFQVNEIEEATLVLGEDEELNVEKKRLKSADSLIKLSQGNYRLLSGSVLEDLGQVRRDMSQIVILDPQAEELAEKIAEYVYQVEDVAVLLRNYRDSLNTDPLRLDQVNERLDLLQNLKRKYGQKIEDILLYKKDAQDELQNLDDLEVQLCELQEEVRNLERTMVSLADDLSEDRHGTAETFSLEVSRELLSLAFTEPKFEVRWLENGRTIDTLLATGWDRVEFFFSANLGEQARPLAKVASGGELSRLMLALKCILARKDMVDTVIFDEVDAGIGGEAAEAVAKKIQELASHHQVFCITHLPQIASRGYDHYLVTKDVENGRTQSRVTRLSDDERVQELARMLAGTSVSAQTQAWAKELLEKGGSRL